MVCGAANVAAGRKYPFAPVGATLPGGLRIEERKLRGQTSQGMLCSARELGLGQDGDGLWELQTDAVPGRHCWRPCRWRITDWCSISAPNRPDLLGHKGIARELAASYGVPFRLPAMPSPALTIDVSAGPAGGGHGVSVACTPVPRTSRDVPGCSARSCAGCRIAPSPAWLARRLEAVGSAINNVVDATNYVMLELNQPMHAYDLKKLRGPGSDRPAGRSERRRFTTLDGVWP